MDEKLVPWVAVAVAVTATYIFRAMRRTREQRLALLNLATDLGWQDVHSRPIGVHLKARANGYPVAVDMYGGPADEDGYWMIHTRMEVPTHAPHPIVVRKDSNDPIAARAMTDPKVCDLAKKMIAGGGDVVITPERICVSRNIPQIVAQMKDLARLQQIARQQWELVEGLRTRV